MNYRLYSFVNFYLSSIQQGVQTAHLVAEMFTKIVSKEKKKTLNKWALKDKTIIILNGGSNLDIAEKYAKLNYIASGSVLPVGMFCEDDTSLGGIMTCCGVVVHETAWAAVDNRTARARGYPNAEFHSENCYHYIGEHGSFVYFPETPEHDLISMIKSCRLAQ